MNIYNLECFIVVTAVDLLTETVFADGNSFTLAIPKN